MWLLPAVLYATSSRRWIEVPDRARWTGSIVWGGLALLTHHFTAFVILAVELFASASLFLRQRGDWFRPMMRRFLVLLPFLMLSAAIVARQYPGSGGQEVGKLFETTGYGGLRLVVQEVFGSREYAFAPSPPGSDSLRLGYVLMLSAVVLGVARRDREVAFWSWVVAVPFAIAFVLSFHVPTMTSRFLLPSIAALWASVACGMRHLPKSVQVAVAATCFAYLGIGVYRQVRYPIHPP